MQNPIGCFSVMPSFLLFLFQSQSVHGESTAAFFWGDLPPGMFSRDLVFAWSQLLSFTNLIDCPYIIDRSRTKFGAIIINMFVFFCVKFLQTILRHLE